MASRKKPPPSKPTLLLALDPAKRSGWALFKQNVEDGDWDLVHAGVAETVTDRLAVLFVVQSAMRAGGRRLQVVAEDWQGHAHIIGPLKQAYGRWEGLLEMLEPEVARVYPQVWRKAMFPGMGKTTSDGWKTRAVDRVEELLGDRLDDNAAEAILIGMWFIERDGAGAEEE